MADFSMNLAEEKEAQSLPKFSVPLPPVLPPRCTFTEPRSNNRPDYSDLVSSSVSYLYLEYEVIYYSTNERQVIQRIIKGDPEFVRQQFKALHRNPGVYIREKFFFAEAGKLLSLNVAIHYSHEGVIQF